MQRRVARAVGDVDVGVCVEQTVHDIAPLRDDGEMQGGFPLTVLRLEIQLDTHQKLENLLLPEFYRTLEHRSVFAASLIWIRLGVEQSLQDSETFMLDRQLQGRGSIERRLVRIGAKFEKSRHEFYGCVLDGQVESAPSRPILRSQIGAGFQEPMGDCRMPTHGSQM